MLAGDQTQIRAGGMSLSGDTEFIGNLIGASQLLAKREKLEDGLRELAATTAHMLQAEKCSIMLVSDEAEAPETSQDMRLRVYANYGALPQAAYEQGTRFNEGISGHVAATAKPLLVEDISRSRFAGAARYAEDSRKSLISAPILLGGKVIGVINITSPLDGRTFTEHDLELLNIFALFVGQSIHIVQLQSVLRSRFLQLALALEDKEGRHPDTPLSPDPAHLAKIVAKTIFRELNQGGFSSSQILNVASEVIGLLNEELETHKHRVERGDGA
jgi:L-methionine (R)-S-oxide reductase